MTLFVTDTTSIMGDTAKDAGATANSLWQDLRKKERSAPGLLGQTKY